MRWIPGAVSQRKNEVGFGASNVSPLGPPKLSSTKDHRQTSRNTDDPLSSLMADMWLDRAVASTSSPSIRRTIKSHSSRPIVLQRCSIRMSRTCAMQNARKRVD